MTNFKYALLTKIKILKWGGWFGIGLGVGLPWSKRGSVPI